PFPAFPVLDRRPSGERCRCGFGELEHHCGGTRPMTFLSDDLRNRILDLLPRYPNKQAVTLPALHMVQDEHRCVPLPAIRDIADLLDLSPAEVADTMTFYGFFRSEENPLGQSRIWVCRSLACQLRGCDDLI